jgi:hypothetical protein
MCVLGVGICCPVVIWSPFLELQQLLFRANSCGARICHCSLLGCEGYLFLVARELFEDRGRRKVGMRHERLPAWQMQSVVFYQANQRCHSTIGV